MRALIVLAALALVAGCVGKDGEPAAEEAASVLPAAVDPPPETVLEGVVHLGQRPGHRFGVLGLYSRRGQGSDLWFKHLADFYQVGIALPTTDSHH